ncbi:MAG: hypothetical protein AAF671_08280 [Pseudomonadota bacterium]
MSLVTSQAAFSESSPVNAREAFSNMATRRPLCWAVGATLGTLLMTQASWAENVISEAISGGKPLLRMHGRVELVDDEANTLDDATAFTWRTYFGYETGNVGGFSVRLAAENVLHIVDDFNVPGESSNGFDVVADPEGTEIEEAFVRYTGIEDTTVTIGRQYVTYRPAPLHRFIGTVPWRQNWQSMDALTVENKSIENLRINYAYIDNVNRIFGNDNPNENLAESPMSSHLVNLQYSGLPVGSLEGFYYRLDYDRDFLPAPFTDRETIGAKLQGKSALADDLSLSYLLEASHQRAIEDNPTAFDSANQYRVELALTKALSSGPVKSVMGKVGYEVLESDNGISFSTPLATVHAFQGWADRFIGFPGAGVKDAYVVGSAKFAGDLSLVTILHDFESDAGGIDYGEEFDLQLTKKFGKVAVSFKHASYFGSDDADAGATGIDKTVTWAFVNYVF